jgi:hypothetical protein
MIMFNIQNKKILINYADGGFYESQINNSHSALMAGFNIVYQMHRENIDADFYEQNREILECPRGAGYWIWKYYFQDKILSTMTEEDILMYCDSGSNFIRSAEPLFQAVRSDPMGLICFLTPDRPTYHLEKMWTKKAVLSCLGVDGLSSPERMQILNTPQIQAGFRIMRGTQFVKDFTKKCLEYACKKELVDDTLSQNEDSDFKEHRHDQSIWSVMCKLHSVTCMDDFSQWGHSWRQKNGSSDNWFFVDLHKTNR